MEFRTRVEQLLNDFLAARPELFLIELKISTDDNITVILDGDRNLTLQDCLDASRAIESNLDREERDFGLQVTSPGLSEPLNFPRQYKKNIGRKLDILLNDFSKIEGELVFADEEKIVLKLEYKRPKLIGKGKENVVEEREIPYSQIKKALVIIKF